MRQTLSTNKNKVKRKCVPMVPLLHEDTSGHSLSTSRILRSPYLNNCSMKYKIWLKPSKIHRMTIVTSSCTGIHSSCTNTRSNEKELPHASRTVISSHNPPLAGVELLHECCSTRLVVTPKYSQPFQKAQPVGTPSFPFLEFENSSPCTEENEMPIITLKPRFDSRKRLSSLCRSRCDD